MSYVVSNTVLEGLKTVVAMEENISMPAVEDVVVELDFLSELLEQSVKYYGVPFRSKQAEHDVIQDVKSFLEEFYFGSATRGTHAFRPRAMYRLIIEPMLDELSKMSHGVILDSSANVIEQLKERAVIFRRTNKMDYQTAYKQYQQMAAAQQTEANIKRITAGVWKLRFGWRTSLK